MYGGQPNERIPFHHLEEMTKRFASPADPLFLTHEIRFVRRLRSHVSTDRKSRLDEKCEEGAKFYDIEVELADPARLQMKQVLEALGDGDPTTRQIASLDEKVRLIGTALLALTTVDQIADSVARIKEASKRRTFFSSFADDPVTFLSTWLSSQSADLDTLLGRDRGVDASAAGRSESFKGDWVAEGVALYESRNLMHKAAAGGFRR